MVMLSYFPLYVADIFWKRMFGFFVKNIITLLVKIPFHSENLQRNYFRWTFFWPVGAGGGGGGWCKDAFWSAFYIYFCMLIGTWLALSRTSTSEMPQRKSPATPRTGRQSRTPGSDSDSASSSPNPASKTPKDRSLKVEHKSPRSPLSEVFLVLGWKPIIE